MPESLGTAVLELRTSDRDFVRGIDSARRKTEEFSGSIKTLGSSLSRIGGSMSKFVTLPIIGAFAGMVKGASDLKESINAVNVVFGDSARVITDWTKNAAGTIGVTATEANQALTVMGGMLQNAGIEAGEAARQSMLLTERAADMASVFNTDVTQALDAINAALRGEIDPIERFAVSMNAATVKSYALREGIIATSRELTLEEKALARVGLLLEQTDKLAGDFSNTQDDLANSLKTLVKEVKTLATSFGEILLPIAEKIVLRLRAAVATFSSLTVETQELILIVLGVTAVLGPFTIAVGLLAKAIGALVANPLVLFVSLAIALGIAIGAAVSGVDLATIGEGLFEEALIKTNEALLTGNELLKSRQDFLGTLSIAEQIDAQVQSISLLNQELAMLEEVLPSTGGAAAWQAMEEQEFLGLGFDSAESRAEWADKKSRGENTSRDDRISAAIERTDVMSKLVVNGIMRAGEDVAQAIDRVKHQINEETTKLVVLRGTTPSGVGGIGEGGEIATIYNDIDMYSELMAKMFSESPAGVAKELAAEIKKLLDLQDIYSKKLKAINLTEKERLAIAEALSQNAIVLADLLPPTIVITGGPAPGQPTAPAQIGMPQPLGQAPVTTREPIHPKMPWANKRELSDVGLFEEALNRLTESLKKYKDELQNVEENSSLFSRSLEKLGIDAVYFETAMVGVGTALLALAGNELVDIFTDIGKSLGDASNEMETFAQTIGDVMESLIIALPSLLLAAAVSAAGAAQWQLAGILLAASLGAAVVRGVVQKNTAQNEAEADDLLRSDEGSLSAENLLARAEERRSGSIYTTNNFNYGPTITDQEDIESMSESA